MDETMMIYGGSIKTTDDGRVSGYLVRFGSPRDTDLEGDFFTKSTDFGRPMQVGETYPLRLYYAHGMDPRVGRKAIGEGVVKMDDAGLWYEGQIEQSDEYRAMIKRLAQEGRLGFSSGAAGHLVIREATGVGKSARIVAWPLGEASLTPRPAEARNMATVKSLAEVKDAYEMPDMSEMPGEMPEAEDELPASPADVFAGWQMTAAESIIGQLTGRMLEAVGELLEYGRPIDEIDGVLTEYHRILLEVAKMPTAGKSFRRQAGRPATIKQFERQLRDALSLSRREAATIASKSWPILRDAEDGSESDTTVDGPAVAANNDDQTKLRSALLRRLIAQRIAVQAAVEV
jgi:phage head maturation protease